MGKEVSESTKVEDAIQKMVEKSGFKVISANNFLNPHVSKVVISNDASKVLCMSLNAKQKQIDIIENKGVRFPKLNQLLSILESFGFCNVTVKSLQ